MRLDPNVKSTLRLDTASSSVKYLGIAAVGQGESNAAWSIKRLTTTGTVLAIEWADGNDNYDNVWANRASLSYS
jgi:hypothetical protein